MGIKSKLKAAAATKATGISITSEQINFIEKLPKNFDDAILAIKEKLNEMKDTEQNKMKEIVSKLVDIPQSDLEKAIQIPNITPMAKLIREAFKKFDLSKTPGSKLKKIGTSIKMLNILDSTSIDFTNIKQEQNPQIRAKSSNI